MSFEKKTHHSLALLDINLVADNDLHLSAIVHALSQHIAYKWEALRVHGASLDQELVPPAVECIKTLGVVDVVNEHAAVGAAVECDTERLEALLSGRVPELCIVSRCAVELEARDPPAW